MLGSTALNQNRSVFQPGCIYKIAFIRKAVSFQHGYLRKAADIDVRFQRIDPAVNLRTGLVIYDNLFRNIFSVLFLPHPKQKFRMGIQNRFPLGPIPFRDDFPAFCDIPQHRIYKSAVTFGGSFRRFIDYRIGRDPVHVLKLIYGKIQQYRCISPHTSMRKVLPLIFKQ